MQRVIAVALLGLLVPAFAEQAGGRKLTQSGCSLDTHCGSNQYCGGQSGCLGLANLNSPCYRNGMCGSGYCELAPGCQGDLWGVLPGGCTRGLCLPPPPPKVPDWGRCNSNVDCGSGFCELGQCAARCNGTVINCGPGRVCTFVNSTDCSYVGDLCLLAKGKAKPGAFCINNGDCSTNKCLGGVCSFKCNVFRWGSLSYGCPAPFYCQNKYCYPPLVPLYGYCNYNSQCGSGYCGTCGALPCCLKFNITVNVPVPSFRPRPVDVPVPVAPGILCPRNFPDYSTCSSDCECACGSCWQGQCRVVSGCGSNLPDLARCTADCECGCGMCFMGFCKRVIFACGANYPIGTKCLSDCECASSAGGCNQGYCGQEPPNGGSNFGQDPVFVALPGSTTTGTIFPGVKPTPKCGAQLAPGQTCIDKCECNSGVCYIKGTDTYGLCQGPAILNAPPSAYPRVCQPSINLGQACEYSCECFSGFCVGGVCSALG